jgi:hypothetical protein
MKGIALASKSLGHHVGGILEVPKHWHVPSTGFSHRFGRTQRVYVRLVAIIIPVKQPEYHGVYTKRLAVPVFKLTWLYAEDSERWRAL